MTDISKAAVDALMQGVTGEPISDQRIKYENLCARIAVGKASQQDAIDAIKQLCADNERLAVLAGKRRAALDEAEATLKSVLDREAAAYARHDAALAKAEAERDAANALLREAVSKIQSLYDGIAPLGEGRFAEADETVQTARAHLGAKP